jgi:OFA family oxalate/formate antiporter-like MFS transporter
MAALTLAISLDRIFDGFGRPFFGWVSDNIGREHTMFIAFGIGRADLAAGLSTGAQPARVRAVRPRCISACSARSIRCSRRPAATPSARSTPPATPACSTPRRGTAAFLVPFASVLSASYGWSAVFGLIIGLNILAAALAVFVLKPMRRRYLAAEAEIAEAAEARAVKLA